VDNKKAVNPNPVIRDRRQLLRAVGGGVMLVSVSGLAACGGGESPTPQAPANPQPENVSGTGNDTAMSEPMDNMQQQAQEPAADAASQGAGQAQPSMQSADAAASGDLPRLNPSDPQAQALAYVHDASSINPDEQPRYQSGQACRNCTLYSGAEGADWGPCSIFAGKAVNAGGWCNVYAPKA